VPESTFEINVQMEQASKGLDDAVAKAVRLEQRLADVTRRLGENSQATKTTKSWYDKANAAAEKMWIQQQRELNKIEGALKRVGSSIDKDLVKGVDKFGEAIDKAGQRFDTSISGKFVKIEKEIKRANEEAKRFEEISKRAQRDPVLSHMQRWRATGHPSAEQMYQTTNLKRPWSAPKVEERARTAPEQFQSILKNLFTHTKKPSTEENKLITDLGNSARVATGLSGGGGGAHYGLISGLTGLLKRFMMAPTAIQLIATAAGAALLTAGAAVALAEPIMRRGRRAREFGVDYGTYEAAEQAFAPTMDVGQAMAAAREARDPTSQQYIGMMQLGLRPTDNPAEDAANQNIALKRYMGQFKDFGTFLANLHNTPLGSLITTERAYSVAGQSIGELQDQKRQMEVDKERFKLNKEAVASFTRLNVDINRFGLNLETIVAKDLSGFADVIDNFVVMGMDSDAVKLFSQWLKTDADSLVTFGRFLGDTITAQNQFGKDLKQIADGLNWINTTVQNAGKALHDWVVSYFPGTDQPKLDMEAKPPPGTPFMNWKGLIPNTGETVPQFQTGAYNVPNSGMAMLHENELVMPAKEASAFRDMLKGSTDEGSKDFGEFNKQLMKSSDIIIDLSKSMQTLNDEINSGRYLAEKYGDGGQGSNNFLAGVAGLGPNPVGGGGAAPPSGGPARAGASEAGELGRGPPGGGGPSGPGGAGIAASGNLKKNQQEAYKAAIESGLSKDSANALVANMSGEALGKPGDVHWDVSHWARGIVQWDPQRSAAIQKQFGKLPNEMSVGEQTKAAIWEMQNNPAYKETWNALKGGGSVESKISTLVSNYERPANKQAAYNQRMGYYKKLGDLSGGGGGDGRGSPATNMPDLSDSGDWTDHLSNMKKKGLLTDQQCVTLAMASVGIKKGSGVEGANVHDWRRGESAEAGDLTKGTPISTFLDRAGRQSNLYAGGGAGTMGAGLDHAAVFDRYIRNNLGKITGMMVEEQYKGSGGVHEREYDFGKGFGEHNASNYSRIRLASGGYLGGLSPTMVAQGQQYGPKSKVQEQASAASSGRVDPYGRTPHMGDMSQYHKDTSPNVTIFNKSGSNVNLQTASLGSAQGNFDA
jgi:Phage tail lysozyme